MFCCEILRASCFLRWANALFITAILTGVIFIWTLGLNGYPSKYDHPAYLKCINCGRDMQLFGKCCTQGTITDYDCVSYERCREMQLTGKANDDEFNGIGVDLIIAGSVLEALFIIYVCVLFSKELKRRKLVQRRLGSLLANEQRINSSQVVRERPIRREEPIRREPLRDPPRAVAIREPARRQQRDQAPVFVDSSTECSICLLDFDAFLPVINRDNCGHKFHQNCLKDWSKINPKCPICRRD